MAEYGMLGAIEPTTPVGIAAPVILWSKAQPLFELHAQALTGDDAEAVHDIRLAARRTREALEIFEALYESEEYEWISQIVRQITRALGPIRDADASIEEFAHLVEQLHGEDTRTALAYLIGYAAGDRAVRVQAMKGRLRLLNLSEKRPRFELGLHGFRRNADVATTLQSFASSVIPERLDAVLAHLPTALVRESNAEQQQMRTDIRHLRHAVETFRPVFGTQYKGIYRLLTEMQDILVKLSDRDVFIGLVRAAESQPEASTAHVSAGALEEVVRALAAERDALFRQFRTIMEEHRPQALRARIFSAAGIEGYAMPPVELEVAEPGLTLPEVSAEPSRPREVPQTAEMPIVEEAAAPEEAPPAWGRPKQAPPAREAQARPAPEAEAPEVPTPAVVPAPAEPDVPAPAAAGARAATDTAEMTPVPLTQEPHAPTTPAPPTPTTSMTPAAARREILARKLKAAREMSTMPQPAPVIGEGELGESEVPAAMASSEDQPTAETDTGQAGHGAAELPEEGPPAETAPLEETISEEPSSLEAAEAAPVPQRKRGLFGAFKKPAPAEPTEPPTAEAGEETASVSPPASEGESGPAEAETVEAAPQQETARADDSEPLEGDDEAQHATAQPGKGSSRSWWKRS